MSGETRMVRPAMMWGLIALPVVTGVAYLARGTHGAISASIAAALVLANAITAAAISALAARKHIMAAGFVSLPSFAVRMAGILIVLTLLKGASFIDKPTFALTFGAAVTAVLVLEARSFRKTPWLAMTFEAKEETR